jgi:hypothetical protein
VEQLEQVKIDVVEMPESTWTTRIKAEAADNGMK